MKRSFIVLALFAGWRITMTTEASSETEVKEKAEESEAQPDQSEKATEENQGVANAEGEVKEKETGKEGKEGKGISRYLPTWLKKQKSQSQVEFSLKTYYNAAAVVLWSSHNCFLFLFTHEDLPDQGGRTHRGNH